MAGLSHADQSRFPLPRLDSCRAYRSRPGSVSRPGQAQLRIARPGRAGVAQLLFQVSNDRARFVPRARSLHPIDEAEEYAAPPEGRGTDHAPGIGVLRLKTVSVE